MTISLNKKILIPLFIIVIDLWGLSIWWDTSPSIYDVKERTQAIATSASQEIVPGYTTTTTLIELTSWLVDKPGGFLSNDMTPPGLIMDNMPAFEYGVLEQVRDLALVMRLDFSRSQSQSTGDKDLEMAQSKLNISHKNWVFPSAEGE